MATVRKSMSPTTRKKVLTRDGHTCQKCGKNRKLNLHHIKPVPQGQDDSPENLVTLCKHCHSEWEHIVYVNTDKVTFRDWLAVPPALELIAIFSQERYWQDSVSAKDARDGIIQGFQFVKECRPYDEGEEEE